MKGIGASQGYCMGRALVKKEIKVLEKAYAEDRAFELIKLNRAIETALTSLAFESEIQVARLGQEQGEIFKAHLMMLSDPELQKSMKQGIEAQGFTASYAVQETMVQFVQMFDAMDNAYFKERAIDVKDICIRLIRLLEGEVAVEEHFSEGVVVIAKDLTPSDTAKLDLCFVKGFATAQGGDTSHSAIIARTMGIPAVMGVQKIDETIKNGDFVILDGYTGDVFLNPDEATIKLYEDKRVAYEKEQEDLMVLKTASSVTACGFEIELSANIASVEDVDKANDYGADGVGLFRSEFLYMNRNTPPTEEEQFIAYKTVLEKMNPKPVVIRTLDAGGDKKIPYLNIPEEMNPFLGFRAIRLCLADESLFKTQLRALLRASVYGNLKIMYPMISSLEEVRDAKRILNEVKATLKEEAIPFSDQVEEGIMIEIPAAAMISDMLAKEVDFFSIGTNDLIQYTNAVDRMNEHIKGLYTAYHPAVLRLIEMTIKNGKEAGIWVGMCGSVAGDPTLFPMLLAMGLKEYSMGPNQILKCRKIAADNTRVGLKVHLEKIKGMGTATEIEGYLKEHFGV